MDESNVVRDLMARLMAAVEATLQGSTAVRDALAALGQEGYEARLFFVANAEAPDGEDTDESESEAEDDDVSALLGEPVLRDVGPAGEEVDLRFDLTKLDRDFLKSLNIRPDGG